MNLLYFFKGYKHFSFRAGCYVQFQKEGIVSNIKSTQINSLGTSSDVGKAQSLNTNITRNNNVNELSSNQILSPFCFWYSQLSVFFFLDQLKFWNEMTWVKIISFLTLVQKGKHNLMSLLHFSLQIQRRPSFISSNKHRRFASSIFRSEQPMQLHNYICSYTHTTVKQELSIVYWNRQWKYLKTTQPT